MSGELLPELRRLESRIERLWPQFRREHPPLLRRQQTDPTKAADIMVTQEKTLPPVNQGGRERTASTENQCQITMTLGRHIRTTKRQFSGHAQVDEKAFTTS